MDWKQTQSVRKLLASRGYASTYLDSWQPKVDMWWHRDWKNVDGEVVRPRGTIVPNMPGHPDHQTRMSVRGLTEAQVEAGYLSLLPWPPGPDCRCRTCRGALAAPELTQALRCPDCDYVASGSALQQPFRLNIHRKKHAKATNTRVEVAA